ncbi:MAG: hypothetical protein COV99_04475 [Bacteroidetes bacterium CG12_big_fil_rev_8_21_14_0_65_60_17]|nr:MAG: hypothetical protein COV99_04475 [Bacteroidetes bacterium CG12_big_fil_rev_8_21_14_0_65_60_17]
MNLFVLRSKLLLEPRVPERTPGVHFRTPLNVIDHRVALFGLSKSKQIVHAPLAHFLIGSM